MDPVTLLVLLMAGGAAVYFASKSATNVPVTKASEQTNDAKTFAPPPGTQASEQNRGINITYQGNSFGVNW